MYTALFLDFCRLAWCTMTISVTLWEPFASSTAIEYGRYGSVNTQKLKHRRKIQNKAWEALGDLSYCTQENRFARQTNYHLRQQGRKHRTAMLIEDAEKYYRCSLLSDDTNAQVWVEIADMLVYHGGLDQDKKMWHNALVRLISILSFFMMKKLVFSPRWNVY